jgi:hypothetical protein
MTAGPLILENMKLFCALALGIAMECSSVASAQVQTIVPPVVPGAKPVTVERFKVQGRSLEGNLEGDAVDRDVPVDVDPTWDFPEP